MKPDNIATFLGRKLHGLYPEDQTRFEAVARGEYNISGLQNKTLRARLPHQNSGQISRLLKRLRRVRLYAGPWSHSLPVPYFCKHQ